MTIILTGLWSYTLLLEPPILICSCMHTCSYSYIFLCALVCTIPMFLHQVCVDRCPEVNEFGVRNNPVCIDSVDTSGFTNITNGGVTVTADRVVVRRILLFFVCLFFFFVFTALNALRSNERIILWYTPLHPVSVVTGGSIYWQEVVDSIIPQGVVECFLFPISYLVYSVSHLVCLLVATRTNQIGEYKT